MVLFFVVARTRFSVRDHVLPICIYSSVSQLVMSTFNIKSVENFVKFHSTYLFSRSRHLLIIHEFDIIGNQEIFGLMYLKKFKVTVIDKLKDV